MQTDRLQNWIVNIHRGKTNQDILIINTTSNTAKYNLDILQKISHTLSSNINIVWVDGTQKLLYRYLTNQIIVIVSQNGNYNIKNNEIMKKYIARGIIYLEDYISINKVIDTLYKKENNINSELSYTLLNKIKLEKVLQFDKKSLGEFITGRYFMLNKLLIISWSIDLTLLDDYIAIYEKKKVLLATFIQYLYRIATLDFISTVKAVGGSIHSILGVKSKTINLKSLKIRVHHSMYKNHRVYVLNKNQAQINIKTDIAKKLISLVGKKLDVKAIAKATELPLKDVEKMYKKCFLK